MSSFQTTQSEHEAEKAQEWAKNNPNAKFGNKTVHSILHDTKQKLNGLLSAVPEKGKIDTRLQNGIQAEIDKDTFVKDYLAKKLSSIPSPSERARQGFNEMLEIRAYLGVMSHFEKSISRLAGEARKYIAHPILTEEPKIISRFALRETEYNSLPDVGKSRLQSEFDTLRALIQQVSGSTPAPSPIVPPMPSPSPTPVTPPPAAPLPSPAPTPTPAPTPIHAPMAFNTINIDPSSTNIERNTPNPQITLAGTTLNSHIQVTDPSSGKMLYSGIVARHDSSGNFKISLRGVDVRIIGPQDIVITEIDPNDPSNISENNETINIVEKKMQLTHAPRAALAKPGKQENNRGLTINLEDVIPGTKIQVRNPRISGGVDEFYANGKTFSQNLFHIDSNTPSTAPEELIICMVDPNDPSNKSPEFRLPFEIDYPVLKIERPEISQITDKLDPSDDIRFQMTNAVDESEIIITGPGLSSVKRISVPAGNGPDFEIDLGIKAGPPLIPGKAYEYTIQVDDPKHPGNKKSTKVKIEIDHPVLRTLATPTISNATPVEIRQGAPSKGFLNVNNAVSGAEYILILPNGTEVPAGKATGPTHAVSLNNLDISTVGPQAVIIKVKDPHHDTVTALQTVVDIEVKKKVEAPKHLPQPVFKTPLDYVEGGGDIEIELLNAITHSEVTVEYDTSGGRTTTVPLTVTADGNLKLPLAGFDAPVGTSNITVTYRNPVSGASQTRTISMHIGPRPSIERPEGFNEEVDVITKPSQVKIGKIKPGQTLTITDGEGHPVTISRGGDGVSSFSIPRNTPSEKQQYTVRITDTVTGSTEEFPLTVNVKVAPKANRRIDHHNFSHACKEAQEHGVGHYRINGEAHAFDVRKSWGKYRTNIHGEDFKAKTPDELYKLVKEHLEHHNQHEKDEYNAYWGLMPESSDHKKEGDSHEKSGGKEKADEKGHEKKGGHKDDHGHDKHDHHDEDGTKYDKVVNSIFGNGFIGKIFKGARNMIPKGIRGLSGAAFDGAVASGVVGGITYGAGIALGSAAIGSLVVPAMTTVFAYYGIKSSVKRFNTWRASKSGGSDSHGGGH